ncbi:MAG: RNA pseudouridine synthase, partial [Oscillospiraceae bacterium]|nr:RNA pseudouridine synthase [Oscillospiraceae bacterium]
MQRHEAQVTLLDVDARLDVFAAALAGVTRSRAARWLTEGRVAVNGIIIQKAGFRLSAGQRVSVDVPPPAPSTVLPEALPLHILYEDADLAVVDKPCGMVVHPAAGNANGTLVHALLYHIRDLSGVGGILRPGIVHRLD